MSLHITYCQEFGVSQEEIENTEELQGMLQPGAANGRCA